MIPTTKSSAFVSEENSQTVIQVEKSNFSPEDCVLEEVTHTTTIKYVVTALMFELHAPGILMGSYVPVFAHHVVVMPIGQNASGMLGTLRWILPPFLVTISKDACGVNVPLSVSTVQMGRFEEYFAEVQYRKEYGIQGSLNFQMVKEKIVPCASRFDLLSINTFYCEVQVYPMKRKSHCARLQYIDRLMIELASNCRQYQPIILD